MDVEHDNHDGPVDTPHLELVYASTDNPEHPKENATADNSVARATGSSAGVQQQPRAASQRTSRRGSLLAGTGDNPNINNSSVSQLVRDVLKALRLAPPAQSSPRQGATTKDTAMEDDVRPISLRNQTLSDIDCAVLGEEITVNPMIGTVDIRDSQYSKTGLRSITAAVQRHPNCPKFLLTDGQRMSVTADGAEPRDWIASDDDDSDDANDEDDDAEYTLLLPPLVWQKRRDAKLQTILHSGSRVLDLSRMGLMPSHIPEIEATIGSRSFKGCYVLDLRYNYFYEQADVRTIVDAFVNKWESVGRLRVDGNVGADPAIVAKVDKLSDERLEKFAFLTSIRSRIEPFLQIGDPVSGAASPRRVKQVAGTLKVLAEGDNCVVCEHGEDISHIAFLPSTQQWYDLFMQTSPAPSLRVLRVLRLVCTPSYLPALEASLAPVVAQFTLPLILTDTDGNVSSLSRVATLFVDFAQERCINDESDVTLLDLSGAGLLSRDVAPLMSYLIAAPQPLRPSHLHLQCNNIDETSACQLIVKTVEEQLLGVRTVDLWHNEGMTPELYHRIKDVNETRKQFGNADTVTLCILEKLKAGGGVTHCVGEEVRAENCCLLNNHVLQILAAVRSHVFEYLNRSLAGSPTFARSVVLREVLGWKVTLSHNPSLFISGLLETYLIAEQHATMGIFDEMAQNDPCDSVDPAFVLRVVNALVLDLVDIRFGHEWEEAEDRPGGLYRMDPHDFPATLDDLTWDLWCEWKDAVKLRRSMFLLWAYQRGLVAPPASFVASGAHCFATKPITVPIGLDMSPRGYERFPRQTWSSFITLLTPKPLSAVQRHPRGEQFGRYPLFFALTLSPFLPPSLYMGIRFAHSTNPCLGTIIVAGHKGIAMENKYGFSELSFARDELMKHSCSTTVEDRGGDFSTADVSVSFLISCIIPYMRHNVELPFSAFVLNARFLTITSLYSFVEAVETRNSKFLCYLIDYPNPRTADFLVIQKRLEQYNKLVMRFQDGLVFLPTILNRLENPHTQGLGRRGSSSAILALAGDSSPVSTRRGSRRMSFSLRQSSKQDGFKLARLVMLGTQSNDFFEEKMKRITDQIVCFTYKRRLQRLKEQREEQDWETAYWEEEMHRSSSAVKLQRVARRFLTLLDWRKKQQRRFKRFGVDTLPHDCAIVIQRNVRQHQLYRKNSSASRIQRCYRHRYETRMSEARRLREAQRQAEQERKRFVKYNKKLETYQVGLASDIQHREEHARSILCMNRDNSAKLLRRVRRYLDHHWARCLAKNADLEECERHARHSLLELEQVGRASIAVERHAVGRIASWGTALYGDMCERVVAGEAKERYHLERFERETLVEFSEKFHGATTSLKRELTRPIEKRVVVRDETVNKSQKIPSRLQSLNSGDIMTTVSRLRLAQLRKKEEKALAAAALREERQYIQRSKQQDSIQRHMAQTNKAVGVKTTQLAMRDAAEQRRIQSASVRASTIRQQMVPPRLSRELPLHLPRDPLPQPKAAVFDSQYYEDRFDWYPQTRHSFDRPSSATGSTDKHQQHLVTIGSPSDPYRRVQKEIERSAASNVVELLTEMPANTGRSMPTSVLQLVDAECMKEFREHHNFTRVITHPPGASKFGVAKRRREHERDRLLLRMAAKDGMSAVPPEFHERVRRLSSTNNGSSLVSTRPTTPRVVGGRPRKTETFLLGHNDQRVVRNVKTELDVDVIAAPHVRILAYNKLALDALTRQDHAAARHSLKQAELVAFGHKKASAHVDEVKLVTLTNLSSLERACGNITAALRLLYEVVEDEEQYGRGSASVGTYLNLAAVLTLMEDGDAAVRYARRALTMLRVEMAEEMEDLRNASRMNAAVLSPTIQRSVVTALHNLAMAQSVCTDDNERRSSKATFAATLQIAREAFGEGTAIVAELERSAAEFARVAGQNPNGEPVGLRTTLGTTNPLAYKEVRRRELEELAEEPASVTGVFTPLPLEPRSYASRSQSPNARRYSQAFLVPPPNVQ